MAKIVFIYSTIDGHTLEICKRLQDIAGRQGHEATLVELNANSDVDVAPYDRIVIGASIRYGKHRPDVARFIERKKDQLVSKPSAFFSVNAVARKPDKRTPDTNPYVKKFLKSITWQPEIIGIFAGKIDYPSYGFVDKTMIRFIMWITKGPTDPSGTFEFTDWDAVEAFGLEISAAG